MKTNLNKNYTYAFKGKEKTPPEHLQVFKVPVSGYDIAADSKDIFTKSTTPKACDTPDTAQKEDIFIPKEYIEEEYLRAYVDSGIYVLAKEGFGKKLNPQYSLKAVFNKVYKNNITDFLVASLEKSGIVTIGDLREFLDPISKLPEPLIFNIHDFIEMYPKINNKKDIENFPETLLVSNIASKYYKDESDINANAEFIKKIGYSHELDFYSSYYSLYSENYDILQSPLDRYYLLKYIQSTYDSRFETFKQIADPKSKKKDKDLRKEYNKQHIVIDYLNETEGENWASEFLTIYEPLTKINSLSGDAKKALQKSSFGDVMLVDNHIEFLKFLNRENISPKEVNCYVSNNFTENIGIGTILKNRNQIIQKLKESGISDEKTLELYKNHKNLLNTCFEEDKNFASGSGISSALDVVKKFNIKDDKAFLAFYNKTTGRYSNTHARQDIIDFVNALSFLTDEDIKKCNKNKNLNILNEARKKQSAFETLDESFKNYVSEDNTCAFDIYKKTNNISKTKETIQNLMYNLSLKEAAFFHRLTPYFKTPEEASFFVKNSINSGANGNYDEFGEYCIDVVKALSTIGKSDYVQKLNDSNFIKNSKSDMPKIMETYNTPYNISLFYTTVLDRKVDFAKPFLNFLKKFQDEKGETGNILKHLSSQEKISFEEYEKYISYVQNTLKKYNIPLNVNNSNIMNLPKPINGEFPSEFSKKENIFVAACANALGNSDSEKLNFISKFGNIYTKNLHVDNLQIANELCKYSTKEYENYSSLLGKLFPDTDKETIKRYINKPELLAKKLPEQFANFINNDKCFKMNNKPLGISLHAKLRTFERFITDERNNFDKLDYDKISDKISSIYDVIYHNKPFKIAEPSRKNYFVCYYKYNGSYTGEIKAVFSKDSKLVTIAPANR